MSEQQEFTDSSGDIYTVRNFGDVIELERGWDDQYPSVVRFWTKDATKIIALIAEAAAVKPVPQTPEQIAAFARRWDARVEGNLDEPTEDMGQ